MCFPSGVGQERHWHPYIGPRSPFGFAHSSQIETPTACSDATLVSPRRNQSSSWITDLRWTNVESLHAVGVSIWDEWKKPNGDLGPIYRSEEHTSELQSHSFISYAVFC